MTVSSLASRAGGRCSLSVGGAPARPRCRSPGLTRAPSRSAWARSTVQAWRVSWKSRHRPRRP